MCWWWLSRGGGKPILALQLPWQHRELCFCKSHFLHGPNLPRASENGQQSDKITSSPAETRAEFEEGQCWTWCSGQLVQKGDSAHSTWPW